MRVIDVIAAAARAFVFEVAVLIAAASCAYVFAALVAVLILAAVGAL